MRLIVDTSVGSVVIGSPPHDGAVWRSFCLGTAVDAMEKTKEMRIRHTPEVTEFRYSEKQLKSLRQRLRARSKRNEGLIYGSQR
jgi:hypothetical protein